MATTKAVAQLKILYAKRDRLFRRMQSIYDNATKVDTDTDKNAKYALTYDIDMLDTMRSDFESVLDKIVALELETNPDYAVDYNPLSSFEDLMRIVKGVGRSMQVSVNSEPSTKTRSPKLAPLEIPAFNGDIKNWPLFQAIFSNVVHENHSLSDTEKLHYLISKLEGSAKSVIAGLAPSAENYSIIFNLLKDKFDDKRSVANSYLDQMLDFKPISAPTPNNLEHFFDKFVSSIAALKNVKVDDLLDFVFLHIALRKLDSETVRLFESDQRANKTPAFENLTSFLRDHIKVLQRTLSMHPDLHKRRVTTQLNGVPNRAHTFTTQTYISASSDVKQSSLCTLCHDTHDRYLYDCLAFHNFTPIERFNFVKANNLCINCLRDGHRVSNCKSNSSCRNCNSKHHTLLCFRNFESVNHGNTNYFVSNSPESDLATASVLPPAPSLRSEHRRNDDVALCTLSNNSISNVVSRGPTTVLLATAKIILCDTRGSEFVVRALLDSASQSNFITRSCCEQLKLDMNKQPSCSFVKGIGGSTKHIQGSVKFNFSSRFDRNITFEMESLVVDKITERLPSVKVDSSKLAIFNDLALADDSYFTPGPIEVLIGVSIFPHLLLSRKIEGEPVFRCPVAMETLLGFVIVGEAPTHINDFETVSFCCVSGSLDASVRSFWEIEEVDVAPALSPDDVVCEEIYSRTTIREDDGRYVVALPFAGDVRSLGDSRKTSERRFLCLERKMLVNPKLKEAYDGVVREYLESNYLSPVLDGSDIPGSPSYIIPHHGVLREDKLTSKLRVVLDGSCKTDANISLNELLYGGQNLQGNLFNIIVNFRLFRIALSADIRQMFLSIGIRQCDRRFQRILYRFNPQEPLKVYEFNRVVFGLRSSPYHALRTIKQLAIDEGESYPKAKNIIGTGLYMDDFVYSVPTEEEGITVASEMINIMKSGQFELVKWTSNSSVVLDTIPSSHKLSAVKEFDASEHHKVLGLCWSPTSDSFSLKIDISNTNVCTKRIMLSTVAKIWDVMGLVAPVVLYAKLLIKQLWNCDCDWDDTPPKDIVQTWFRFKKELPLLSSLTLPRYVGIVDKCIVTLLGFADASERAYGGVIYFHIHSSSGNQVYLVSAKSKVSPKKVVSLARLELCAILVLARLTNAIVIACQDRITFNNILAFSDSTVALCWSHSSPHRWNAFVANRVTKIQNYLSPESLHHISGTENPADCLSRGLTPAQILAHPLWFNGPSWTQLDSTQWPITPFNPSTVSEAPETKKVTLLVSSPVGLSPLLALANRLSSWSKLLRCVLYVCRFVKLLPRRDVILASDLEFAESLVIRELQRKHFSEDINNLKSFRACSRSIQHLKPFIKDELIRVGGRLANSNLEYSHKHPLLLPKRDVVLDMLIDHHHRVNGHAGPELLMSLLRHNYWILSARSLIRNRIHKCLPCFKLRPKPTFPEMAEHRLCRVVESVKPFIHTGTDYAGPFRVTTTRGRGVRSTKAYICLFVCLTTRAVHIELAGDLSTACFMGAFKRFLSRRGPVSKVYSDNGSNYIGAKRLLSELQDFLYSKHLNSEFGNMLAENRIEWSLNTPAASHFGGDWESNIKSLKCHLFRVIGDQILTFEEFSTVLAQIESVMNTRPLCRMLSSDPSEPLALTPAHFLNLTPLRYIPAKEIDDRLNSTSRYDLLCGLVQSFWKRWRRDYLHTLQSRRKWNTPVDPITVGTVVILKTENCPPLHWPLGLVVEVFPNKGVTRIVRIRTATGTYLRPVVRLCPLPNQ